MRRLCGSLAGVVLVALSLSAQAPQQAADDPKSKGTPVPSVEDATKASPHQTFRIGGGVAAPRVIYSPEPKYTKRARKAKQEGVVRLQLIINREGQVQEIKVLKSLAPDLDGSALETVRTWRFTPATKGGQPVAVQITVEVNFRLR